MNYAHKNTKTRFGNYDTYHEPLSEEWINGRSRNHLAYTIVLSAVKPPRKSRLVIYPMSGNNVTLKIDFTDPRKRNFVRNLFYILDIVDRK